MRKLFYSQAVFLGLAILLLKAHGQDRYQVSDDTASGPGSPRVVILRDSVRGAEAAVTPSEGGELSSYKVTFQGKTTELLYHARDYTSPGFKGKAPLLWPAVGPQYPLDKLPKVVCGDGSYSVDGKSYPMPCHGFAKSLPWKEVSRSADKQSARVTLELTDSDSTRRYYPFAFKVDVVYELSNGQLTLNYHVISNASNKGTMPFSIGNHIAFKLPFVEGTDPGLMTLETPNTTQLLHNPSGVGLSGEEKPDSFETPRRLGDFDSRVALLLSGYRSLPYARLVDPGGISVRLTQTSASDLPGQLIRFTIYGGPHEGYLCPEPWFGLANSLNTHKGMIALAPGQSWRWSIQIAPDGPGMHAASHVEVSLSTRWSGDF